MAMNRRNVLVGLGGLTVGGGALFASGAFTTVEAQRTVSVTTSGDQAALVGFDITSDTLAGSIDDTIEFDLGDLNLDAITRFDGGFVITNNRENTGDVVDISIEADGGDITTEDAESESAGMYFETGTLPDDLQNIDGDGGSVTLDVVFNMEGETETTSANDVLPDTITIVATDSS